MEPLHCQDQRAPHKKTPTLGIPLYHAEPNLEQQQELEHLCSHTDGLLGARAKTPIKGPEHSSKVGKIELRKLFSKLKFFPHHFHSKISEFLDSLSQLIDS